MPTPPLFRRAPRLRSELPTGKVEILAPSTAPTEPSTSLTSVLLPAGATVLGLAVMIAVGASSGSNLGLTMAISLPMMLASYAVSFINYYSQKRKYRSDVSEREEKYRALLQTHRQELERLHEKQQAALCQNDPDPTECLGLAERRERRRLWARKPGDADFLTLRLGLGEQPLAVKVKAPKQQSPLEPDPLIQEARDLAEKFAQVPDSPICLPLLEAGVAGLTGPRQAVLNAARVLAVQVATHHSPAEVKIVAVYPAGEADDWDWLRWLPHVWTDDRNHRFLAQEKDAAHDLLISLNDLLNRRRLQAQTRKGTDAGAPLPYLVFFLADPRLVEGEPILSLLLSQGAALSAFSIFLADRLDSLPKGCQAMAKVGPGQPALLQQMSLPPSLPYEPDRVSRDLADRFSRTMTPIRLQRLSASTEIPDAVPLLDLLEAKAIEDLAVEARWKSGEPYRSLAAPIGMKAGGEPLYLDLHERAHGPHGLGAGATGSGKSELLQSLIASLAVHFHPHDLDFVLIDYKGGGMANAFRDLPHLVGTITNLQGSLAARALAAFKAELKQRQRLFDQVGVNHIDAYQRRYRKGQVKKPLPHLVIIADEFAELAQEQPDFMRELVSAVRVGRSLGVHLILATQKPAGVVNEQIWSNARFRFCLRVERPEDSQDVLKCPDAANLTRPGRAYFQVGNNEVFELFQAAWGGAPYVPGGFVSSGPHEIVEVALDGSRRPLCLSPKPTVIQAAGSQLEAVVGYIKEVAEREGIARLPGPWLEPLPERVTLEGVRPAEGWDGQTWQPAQALLTPIIGLVDDPARQRQAPLRINLGKEGHLAVYGAPGTGKTTFVQTLVTALVLTHSPQDVNIYILDFGRRYNLYKPLPHVGGVVSADEEEKLNRLLRYFLREMEARKERFAQAGVGTLPAYRAATSRPLPAIVVALDDYTGFINTYPNAEGRLAQVAREGGNLGVHLVIAANSPSAIRRKVSNNITLAVALQLTDPGDYSMTVGRTGGLVPAPLPGRGLVKGKPPLEFQTALPIAGDTEAERTAALKALVQQMADAWRGPVAQSIPVLPDMVPLADLLPPADVWSPPLPDGSLVVPVGLEADDLEPLAVDLWDGPHFLITSPVESGKTTFLQTWLLALAERYPPERLHFYLVDFRRSGLLPLRWLPHVQAYVADDDRFGESLAEIEQALRERRQALQEARQQTGRLLDERAFLARYPALVLAIDDFDAFSADVQFGTKERLGQMIRRERGMGFHLLLAGSTADVSKAFDDWIKTIKDMQTGFLLGSSDHSDLQLFNLRLPMGEAGQVLPPGQGYYSRRGRFARVKAATCHAGAITLPAWVKRIKHKKLEAPQVEPQPKHGRESQPGVAASSLVGRTLGKYQIVEQIGQGGMAAVFKAYEPALDRYLAVKVLSLERVLVPGFSERFTREARAVAQLNHPNILPIISFGQAEGLSYIVMKYVAGGTLRDWLKAEPMDLIETVCIIEQIAAALDHAHGRGILHRDVKPSNVLLDEGSWVQLADFGLAKMMMGDSMLTESGTSIGTPAYTSPEQGQGLPVDHRTDIYSLGVILYEMATGQLPYEAETPMGVVVKHISEPLPRPCRVNPAIPEEVEAVILKALAKSPAERYDSAGEMARALRRAVANSS